MLKRRILSILLVLTMFIPAAYAAQPAQDGMRGVWVATVANIDYPTRQGMTADELRQEADTILDNIVSMGLNAVFLQVRPSADALYQSSLFPWSRYVSGTAGQAPDQDFDVLAYWVTAAHSRGLQLHAWLNPYRITRDGQEEYDALPENSTRNGLSNTKGTFTLTPAFRLCSSLLWTARRKLSVNTMWTASIWMITSTLARTSTMLPPMRAMVRISVISETGGAIM